MEIFEILQHTLETLLNSVFNSMRINVKKKIYDTNWFIGKHQRNVCAQQKSFWHNVQSGFWSDDAFSHDQFFSNNELKFHSK